ncbi:hypothetical protein CVT25_000059 [Psilocybe cyanescens]|uniref:Uncharacterized protein n=1 Tax=Psilocybe cyanescens TaxID=93625 RepID=A0A409X8H2_PSICY|nr:hypothetical protein CVT25_000059 [Psilocybe cyanescens]
MFSEEDQNCILEVEENVNLLFEPLQPPPAYDTASLPVDDASPNTRKPPQVNKSTPIDDAPFTASRYEDSKPKNKSAKAPVNAFPADITPIDGAVTADFVSRIKSILRSPWRKLSQSSQQEEEEYALQPNRFTLIIPLERDGLTMFNLEAQLGEKQVTVNSKDIHFRTANSEVIHFRCSSMPAGRFKEIQLFVRLSDPGASNSNKIINTKKLKVSDFHPRGTEILGKPVQVEHYYVQEFAGNVAGGAFGANAGVMAKRNHDTKYTQAEGAEVSGVYKAKDMSEILWTWTAPKLPGAILKGTCEFCVEVENVKDTVKAGFRVVCKMEKGITNLLQSDIEAPKKQKPKIDHVVTKLRFSNQS